MFFLACILSRRRRPPGAARRVRVGVGDPPGLRPCDAVLLADLQFWVLLSTVSTSYPFLLL